MAKQTWQGGNMLYPLPAVMVSCANAAGEKDIVTVAWAGTVCTNPPEFVVNLVTARLQRACDWCGVRSGRDYDKWAECRLTPAPATTLELAPAIEESPVSIECRVRDVLELGSHHLFLADVTAVQVEDALLDDRGRLDLARAGLTAYSHGEYFELGRRIGTFGYSVRKLPAKGGRR